MTTIQSLLCHGDFESAYRLAYVADTPNHDLIAALSLLCDAPTESDIYAELTEGSEEEYQHGYDTGKDEGYEEGRYDAATLADRHCRALVEVESTLGRLRDRLRQADLPKFDTTAFDNAMLALSMVVEELDDYYEAFHEAARTNRRRPRPGGQPGAHACGEAYPHALTRTAVKPAEHGGPPWFDVTADAALRYGPGTETYKEVWDGSRAARRLDYHPQDQAGHLRGLPASVATQGGPGGDASRVRVLRRGAERGRRDLALGLARVPRALPALRGRGGPPPGDGTVRGGRELGSVPGPRAQDPRRELEDRPRPQRES